MTESPQYDYVIISANPKLNDPEIDKKTEIMNMKELTGAQFALTNDIASE